MKRISWSSQFLRPIAVLLAAFFLYRALFALFYIGYFTDDAVFISLAHSILGGNYFSIYSSTPSPVTDRLPGFPLLLAIWISIFGERLLSFKFLSIIMTLSASFFLYHLAGGKKSTRGILTMLFFAFNPIVARYATAVMAEPTFNVAMLTAILLLDKKTWWASYGAAAMLAAACYIRPQGVLLFAAALFFLTFRREWKMLAIVIFTTAFLFAPFLLRNYLLAGETSGYLTLARGSFARLFHWKNYAIGLKAVLGVAFPQGLFGFPSVDNFYVRRILAWSGIALGFVFMIRGVIRSKRQAAVSVGFIYVIISLILLPLWFAIEARYVLILIPAILLAAGAGLTSLHKRSTTILLAILGIAYVWGDIGLLLEAAGADRHSGPVKTMEWIRGHTRSDDVFLSQIAAVIYLDTQRKCDDLFISRDLTAFTYRIRQLRTAYILMPDEGVVGEDDRPGFARRQLQQWIRDAGQCELAFAQPEEQIKLYKVHSGDVITSLSSQ